MNSTSTRLGPLSLRTGRTIVAALSIVASLAAAPTARAGLVVSAPDITATAGTSGTFDVLVTNTNAPGGASYQLAGDQFSLSVSGTGIVSTGATTATASEPYVYAASTDNDFGLTLSLGSFPATGFTAVDTGDFTPSYPGYTTIAPGQSYGLADVSYSISPSAQPGTYTLSIDDVTLTEFGNPTQAPPTTTANGSITIAAIPEPATWIQAVVALAIAPLVLRRRSDGVRRAKSRILWHIEKGPGELNV